MKIEDFKGIESIPLDVSITKSNNVLPDPYLFNYYDDLKNRILYLDSEIERDSLIPLTKMILSWNREDYVNKVPISERKPIKIFIFSYGGEIDATLHFIDICITSKTPIYTYNMGVAMSGGFYILLAGSKRFALKNSQSLCHQGSGGFQGSAEDIKTHTAQYNKLLKVLSDYTLERTKIPKELYAKKKRTEWFINGSEQVELGIIDKIIEDMDEVIY